MSHCNNQIGLLAHSKNGGMYMALNHLGQQESCASIGVLARMQNVGEDKGKGGGGRGRQLILVFTRTPFTRTPIKNTKDARIRSSEYSSPSCSYFITLVVIIPHALMQFACQFFDREGNQILRGGEYGCPRRASACHFIHPSDPNGLLQDQPVRVYSLG
jgi:hypothetical protein